MQISRGFSFKKVNQLLGQGGRQHSVQVGFFNGATYPGRTGVTVAQVALWNEYGFNNGPERPFIRTAFRKTANNITLIRQLGRRVLAGDLTMDAALNLLGKEAVKVLKQSIADFGGAGGNAEATILSKGFDRPLLNTGLMYENVMFEKV